MSQRSPKDIARDVLAHQLGVPQRQPAKLTDAQRVVSDFMAGRATPAEPGTPEHELQSVLARDPIAPAPEINREALLAQLANDRSPTSALLRDLVRDALARAKAAEGGE